MGMGTPLRATMGMEGLGWATRWMGTPPLIPLGWGPLLGATR